MLPGISNQEGWQVTESEVLMSCCQSQKAIRIIRICVPFGFHYGSQGDKNAFGTDWGSGNFSLLFQSVLIKIVLALGYKEIQDRNN